jgi:hypothetical protein
MMGDRFIKFKTHHPVPRLISRYSRTAEKPRLKLDAEYCGKKVGRIITIEEDGTAARVMLSESTPEATQRELQRGAQLDELKADIDGKRSVMVIERR